MLESGNVKSAVGRKFEQFCVKEEGKQQPPHAGSLDRNRFNSAHNIGLFNSASRGLRV